MTLKNVGLADRFPMELEAKQACSEIPIKMVLNIPNRKLEAKPYILREYYPEMSNISD